MEAEWPKLIKEPQKENDEEAEAKVTEREHRGEAGEGIIEASDATRAEGI